MPHARGPEHRGQEITRREEFVGAREVEEHDGDVVVAERLLEPDGVLDRAREHGDAVGRGDLRAQAGGVSGWADDVFDGGGGEEEGEERGADVAAGGGDEHVGHFFWLVGGLDRGGLVFSGWRRGGGGGRGGCVERRRCLEEVYELGWDGTEVFLLLWLLEGI